MLTIRAFSNGIGGYIFLSDYVILKFVAASVLKIVISFVAVTQNTKNLELNVLCKNIGSLLRYRSVIWGLSRARLNCSRHVLKFFFYGLSTYKSH